MGTLEELLRIAVKLDPSYLDQIDVGAFSQMPKMPDYADWRSHVAQAVTLYWSGLSFESRLVAWLSAKSTAMGWVKLVGPNPRNETSPGHE